MMQWTFFLAAEAAVSEGGLFDIDATLPLMAIQFLLLAAVLNAVFYKPLSQAIDERADYIRTTKTEARERSAKADELAKQLEQVLAAARRESQAAIATAQSEAQQLASQQIAETQQELQAQKEQAQKELDQQKQEVFRTLERSEVDALSRQIFDKLLGSQLVR